MREFPSLRLGHTRCDFLRPKEFFQLCDEWIKSETFHHVVTLNPEMVMMAEHDEEFREAIGGAEIRVPDGSGLIWARWFLRSEFWALFPSLFAFAFQVTERVTGVDTVMELASLAKTSGKPVYLLGGTNSQVTKTAELLRKRFPKLDVSVSDDHVFDLKGSEDVLADIQEKAPAVLLVAYGAPNQSNWIERHRKKLPSVCIAVGVGGAFAILGEERRRAPKLLRKMNMEWLWRLLLEPGRYMRIYSAVVKFPMLIQMQKRT